MSNNSSTVLVDKIVLKKMCELALKAIVDDRIQIDRNHENDVKNYLSLPWYKKIYTPYPVKLGTFPLHGLVHVMYVHGEIVEKQFTKILSVVNFTQAKEININVDDMYELIRWSNIQ